MKNQHTDPIKEKSTTIDRIWNNQRYAVFVRRKDTWMSPPQHTRSLTTFSFIVSEEASYRFGLRKMESFFLIFRNSSQNLHLYGVFCPWEARKENFKLFSTVLNNATQCFCYSALTSFGLRKPFCWGGVQKLRLAFLFKTSEFLARCAEFFYLYKKLIDFIQVLFCYFNI